MGMSQRVWLLRAWVTCVVALLAISAWGQGKPATLESVLNLLDERAASFKSVQTDFVWDQYQSVVNEHDKQTGVMYFKRTGPGRVDVAADIKAPDQKKLLYTGGTVQIYSFRTHQVETYKADQHRDEVESFLALGFGGRGHDLVKNFEVRYAGTETVNGHATYKLELTPKAERVRNMFREITLWIDQQTGMSVQQKALEGQSDYRLATYTNIRVNQPLPGGAFRLPK